MCEAEIGSLSSRGRPIDRREDSRRRPTSPRIPRSILPPLLLHRCFCHWNNEGESREREREREIPILVFRPLSSLLPNDSSPFHRCFLPLLFSLFSCDSLRKSVGPVAVAVVPSVPTIAPNENEKEDGVDKEIITNLGGGDAESTSVAGSSV